nr:MAG TPA: hypothetical protein [Caudoviricetes sp.]
MYKFGSDEDETHEEKVIRTFFKSWDDALGDKDNLELIEKLAKNLEEVAVTIGVDISLKSSIEKFITIDLAEEVAAEYKEEN